MNQARVFKVENRLAKVIVLPGGMTVAAALRRADERVASVREVCLASFAEKGRRLQQLAAIGRAGSDDKAVADLYTTANEVFSIAGAFGMTDLAESAYGLCDLVDSSRERGDINWAAVDVYVDGVRFLGSAAAEADSATRAAIVAGLRQIAGRFSGDV